MKVFKGMKPFLIVGLCAILLAPLASLADDDKSDSKISPVITSDFFALAKKNQNWKTAVVTGKDAQVVFMNITPDTNPKNEIGMETHPFDQVIFIVEGHAKSILDGKESTVKSGDMIYVPQGVPHNFINLHKDKPFKIISVYSDTDMPANKTFAKKSDATD